jgi:hypothetical protein
MTEKNPIDRAAKRRAVVARSVRALRARAAYVIPSVPLDAEHAAALHGFMKAHRIGVSDAVREAVMRLAEPPKKPPTKKPAAKKAPPKKPTKKKAT